MPKSLIPTLNNLLGVHNVITEEQVSARSSGYWNTKPLQAKAVVTPETTQVLSELLKICQAEKQSVVVLGGMTGLTGGQYPDEDDIAVSLEKMNHILEIDSKGNTMTVGAGCTLHQVQQVAIENGMLFGVDIGARGSCTIGGNISTNAGGMEVLRYGMMREQVLGLEAVLADGSILSSLNKMHKNNAGYDLKQLLIGTEGTIGIVTKAVLKLRPATVSAETALIGCKDFDCLVALLNSAQRHLGSNLTRYEVMDGNYVRRQQKNGIEAVGMSTNSDWYALVELCGHDTMRDHEQFETWLRNLFETDITEDIIVAQSLFQKQKLWCIREDFDEIVSSAPCFIYDVSLPIVLMEAYIQQVRAKIQLTWPQSHCYILGHLADGNLHFFVSPNSSENPGELKNRSNELIYSLLKGLGGSISAEHGIGLDKKPWLSISRNAIEIALMAKLKQLFDPNNILNPGRVVDIRPG